VFQAIGEVGKVALADLYAAYNMGTGFTITCRPGGEARVQELMAAHGVESFVMGVATDSERVVECPGVGLRIDAQGFHAL